MIFFKNKLYFIDMSQSVPTSHQKAKEFYNRDIDNMVRFFNKFGIKVSNYFNIPFEAIQWQTRDGNERNVTHLRYLFSKYDQQNILIVDDAAFDNSRLSSA